MSLFKKFFPIFFPLLKTACLLGVFLLTVFPMLFAQESIEVPKLEGQVIGIPSGKGVTSTYINAGEIQGVRQGFQFGVFRNGQMVAVLEVTGVLQKISSVSVLDKKEGITIELGDQVQLVKGVPKAFVVPPHKKAPVASKPGGGPENPPAYPLLSANASLMEKRIRELEQRVEDLEKLLARTYAMIPQVSPENLENPPLPENPAGVAPGVPSIPMVAQAPPVEEITIPEKVTAPTALAAAGQPPKKTAEEEENEGDFWKWGTPSRMKAEAPPQTFADKVKENREDEDEWNWGKLTEKKYSPKISMSVDLEPSDTMDLQGGAKFTANANFLECDSWDMKILDHSGTTVKSFKGKDNIPESLEWDGTNNLSEKLKSGLYAYAFTSTSKANGNSVTNGEIPPRNPALSEGEDWKDSTLYEKGNVAASDNIKQARDQIKDFQTFLETSGKVLFAAALLMLVL